ncbi:MAG: hypothetical protein Q7S84_01525 [bacterium]|nr:hypothetical protein [bacterium]
MKVALGVIFCLILALFVGLRTYNGIVFDIHCGDRLKRAADANTIELAIEEVAAALSYAEQEGMTEGYTSVLYRTPDEDVGFWYRNLSLSLAELKKVDDTTTQLERTNILMKLRETILDKGDTSESVTLPSGISIFPNNVAYMWFGVVGLILCIPGTFLLVFHDDL